jgi:hypothetical protein
MILSGQVTCAWKLGFVTSLAWKIVRVVDQNSNEMKMKAEVVVDHVNM